MATTRSQGRAVLGINAAVSVLLIVLVAAVALVVRPPAPPGIAEFAPQAAKPITHAPPAQAGQFGGSGACAPGVPCTGTQLTPAQRAAKARALPQPSSGVQGVPSALQCFVWPDGSVTQTFDPQSPPCISSWPGAAAGNGGATSSGVTATSIRVGTTDDLTDVKLKALVSFFNRHFELYGRQLVMVHNSVDGSNGDPTSQHAQAVQDAQNHVFGAVYWNNSTTDDTSYLETLAREHIVGVNAYSTTVTAAMLARLSPYAWSYYPTIDNQELNVGQFGCRALVGHAATHAGDATLKVKTRTFAILYPKPVAGVAIDTTPLRNTMTGCGVSATSNPYNGYARGGGNYGNGEQSSPDAGNDQLMLNLKQQGITTVFTAGSSLDAPNALAAANQVDYHPEWLVIDAGSYSPSNYLLAPSDEQATLMGIGYWNKELPRSQDVGYEALQQEDTNPADAAGWSNDQESLYKSLLLIASGVQTAGPELTPNRFGASLQVLRFPNPEADGPPAYQARVGFSASDPAMMDDYALWYWSAAAKDYDADPRAQNTGSYCYIGKGARWQLGSWPTSDPGFFSPTAAC